MNNNHEPQEQRKPPLSLVPSAGKGSISGKPRDFENGHEIILRSIIKKGLQIEITLNASGDRITGKLRQFDSQTLTVIEPGRDTPRTFFKHSIESFTVAD